MPYSYDEWVEEFVKKDTWSTRILKFWFLFSRKHNQSPEFNFPALLDDARFIQNVARKEIGTFEEDEISKCVCVTYRQVPEFYIYPV